MIAIVRSVLGLRFATLRSRLFAAFVGVLVLSLILTGATFWGEISNYDTKQVQSDLQASAPNLFALVKQSLVRYTNQPQGSLESLRDALAADARRAGNPGVRVLLTDYCNHVYVDTSSTAPLTSLKEPLGCSSRLDDVAGGSARVVSLAATSSKVRETDSLPGGGTTFYVAYSAAFLAAYSVAWDSATSSLGSTSSSGSANPIMLPRTIVIAESTAGADQQAINSLLPKLAAAGLFAVLLTLLVVYVIVRAITRPLRSITMASERMAAGDYNQRVPDARRDEVGQLARSFNRMASEVSTAREIQRQLIANVSHDLKTPLTSIVGFSQILTDSEEVAGDPTQRRAVQVINEEARRLQRLTQDLLDLSRLEAGQLQLRRAPIDLNEIAGHALTRYVGLPSNASLHFRDERASTSLVVSGDEDRLMQVLVNLLDNAVKFCDAGGTVAIGTGRRDGSAVLTVANTGTGIAMADLTRVFQRFYRTDGSRATQTGGTGLGLAIVREIVAAHGGTIEARNEGGGWTRFVMYLPLLAVHANGASRGEGQGAGDQPGQATGLSR